MLGIIKSTFRNSLIYSVGTFSSKLIGFILVPLYTDTRYLSKMEFGLISIVDANIQIMATVLGLGLSYGFERWYFDTEYISRRKSIFFTVECATFIIAGGLFTGAWFFSNALSALVLESTGQENLFLLMILAGGIEMLILTPNSLLRLTEQPVLYTVANFLKLCLQFGLSILFVVYYKQGILGVYTAQILGSLLYFVIIGPMLIKSSEIKFEWTILRQIINYRMPLNIHILAINVISFNDRYFIKLYAGFSSLAVYSLGLKFANVIKVFLITAFWLAVTPMIYKMMNHPGGKRFYSKLMTYAGFALLHGMLALILFAKEVLPWVVTSQSYLEAYSVIPVLAFAIFFTFIKDIALIGLNITKKTFSILMVSLVVAGANVLLNYILVPRYGYMGAAYAGLISQLLFFIVMYFTAQRAYRIPYEIQKLIKMISVALLILYAGTLVNAIDEKWLRVLMKLALILSFSFVLYLLDFYEKIEIERLKSFAGKWLSILRRN